MKASLAGHFANVSRCNLRGDRFDGPGTMAGVSVRPDITFLLTKLMMMMMVMIKEVVMGTIVLGDGIGGDRGVGPTNNSHLSIR